ncbi:type II CAAX prenyl endopeptidase Rce1 family protein [Pedobacter sp.]|uniref:CPBP family glutamic-type intramembrane protease n=1 Tax=Pedobacter sp. TaxID=1411316 RepID=UPI003BAC9AFD
MIETLSTYWDFLKSPKLLKQITNRKTLWSEFLWLLMVSLLFAGLILSFYIVLAHFKVIKEYEEKLDFLKKYGVTVAFIIACVFAPIFEEYLFRWHLRKRYATVYFLCFSFAIITIYLIDSSYLIWPILIFFLTLSFVLHGYLKRISTSRRLSIWNKTYPFVFYFTAIFFGIVHFTNMKGLTLSDPSFLIYTSSQMFSGISMGYLRIKFGIKYSILFHGVFNFILMILEFVFG